MKVYDGDLRRKLYNRAGKMDAMNFEYQKNLLKRKYGFNVSRYVFPRLNTNPDIIQNIEMNIEFLSKLFESKGFLNENILDFIFKSEDVYLPEVICMPLGELSLKLYILEMLNVDMEVLFNCPKIIARYFSDELYNAVNLLKNKNYEVGIEDLKLYLHLNNNQKHEGDKELSSVRRVMYSKQYIDKVEKTLNKKVK